MPDPTIAVRRLGALEAQERCEALAGLLMDCVEGGASVSFLWPLERAKALAFWQGVAHGVAAGERILLVAEAGPELLGTVQLVTGQPENQPHRADLAKMLVRRSARRQGVGAALLAAAEAAALDAGRTLLVLDTASAEAERLYARGGWVRVGAVPGYALLPDGAPCATVFYYKRLGPA